MALHARAVEIQLVQLLEVVLVDLRDLLGREPDYREAVAGEIDSLMQERAVESVRPLVNVHQCASG